MQPLPHYNRLRAYRDSNIRLITRFRAIIDRWKRRRELLASSRENEKVARPRANYARVGINGTRSANGNVRRVYIKIYAAAGPRAPFPRDVLRVLLSISRVPLPCPYTTARRLSRRPPPPCAGRVSRSSFRPLAIISYRRAPRVLLNRNSQNIHG